MRTAILALAALLLVSVSAASASIVIHDGREGIVAEADGWVLDSMGRNWNPTSQGWSHESDYDPPVPVDSLLFWDHRYLVTMSGEYWSKLGVWTNLGRCPALSAIPGPTPAAMSASPKTIPNPSAGSCRVAFQTAAVGPVSVHLFDASGRLVRQLHDGPLPTGEFSLPWDGRDDSGQEVPAGAYFAKVTTSAGESTAKLILAR